MGKDGAQGMLDIRNAGGFTIAQDEESCVVYGMPKEAVLIGGVDKIVELEEMGNVVLSKLKQLGAGHRV
jgi:two-component system chemotaxis response regulator CheB